LRGGLVEKTLHRNIQNTGDAFYLVGTQSDRITLPIGISSLCDAEFSRDFGLRESQLCPGRIQLFAKSCALLA